MKTLTPILFTAILFSSCAHSISLQVMQPAEITIPAYINKIGVINRSVITYKQDTKDKIFNIIEGILSGEEIGADRKASEECINGLFNIVTQQNRINYTRLPNLSGTGTAWEKKNLTQDEVDKLCKEYNVNGLLLLESFDSDNTMRLTPGVNKIKNKDGTTTETPVFTADAKLRITSSWRIYDPEQQKIFDEIRNFNERGFSETGPTERDAVMRLPNKLTMLNKTGFDAGVQFGKRISPNWVWVNRQFYKGKGDDMKFGYRLGKSESWDKAAAVWNRNTNNDNKKNAARACYNMALVCEVQGKLELAVYWASKAYEDFGFNPALNYKFALQKRINDDKRLKIQLGE
ncbi:MAG: hypothetical protein IT239_05665 [Bacteroidia bacterium]|nr:hypothetical protein [Bacteroidia bacterium]